MNLEANRRIWNSLVTVHDWLTVDFIYKLSYATEITLNDYEPFFTASKTLKQEQFHLNSEVYRLTNEALEESLYQSLIRFEGIVKRYIQANKSGDSSLQEKLHKQMNEEYNKLVKNFEQKLHGIKTVIDKNIKEMPGFYFPSLVKVGKDLRLNSPDVFAPKGNVGRFSYQGDVTMSDSREIGSISVRDIISSPGTFNLGEISGTVANTINQLPNSSESGKPGIKEPLEQLKNAIENSELNDKDKAKALKQVEAIAKAGKNPDEKESQNIVDDATTMLKGIMAGLAGLPAAANLIQQFKDVLPMITGFFGL